MFLHPEKCRFQAGSSLCRPLRSRAGQRKGRPACEKEKTSPSWSRTKSRDHLKITRICVYRKAARGFTRTTPPPTAKKSTKYHQTDLQLRNRDTELVNTHPSARRVGFV